TSSLKTENCFCKNSSVNMLFLLLIIAKAGLDTLFLYSFNKAWSRSFLGLCGLSITVMDWVMVLAMASVWFFGAERLSVSPCFLLAHASATYGALPLPVMCLGILDYCLDDTAIGRRRPKCKLLRNAVLMLVVWIQGGVHSAGSASSELIEYHYSAQGMFLLCTLQETPGITFVLTLLYSAAFLAMLPFRSRLFQWVTEADRLSEQREAEENKTSDLFILKPTKGQMCEKDFAQRPDRPRPPMWFSLTLAFGVTWMPYLTLSVVCLLCDLTLPGYIVVNNMWLECIHSAMTGVVFWANKCYEGDVDPYFLPGTLKLSFIQIHKGPVYQSWFCSPLDQQ
uniref:G protein-coupled receptor 160 n=1 Tax=Salarias fasciatus TaxID=181472 RepID=A0A672FJ15_SALFA